MSNTFERSAGSRKSNLHPFPVSSSDRRAPESLPEATFENSRYDVFKRCVDGALAFVLILVLSPVLGWVSVRLYLRNRRVIARSPRLGRDCHRFNQFSFATEDAATRNWPVLFNILRGDMSFIGPRAAEPGEFCSECAIALRRLPQEPVVDLGTVRARLRRLPSSPQAYIGPRERSARLRNRVRPGLICDWWIRRCANLAYDSESAVDAEYVANRGFKRDVKIFLRALPAMLGGMIAGAGVATFAEQFRIQKIRLDNLTMSGAIDRIVDYTKLAACRHVCFVNPQCANAAYKNTVYQNALEEADLVLSDGIGMKMAGIILKREIRENVNGTDMFPRLCKALAQGRKSVYLFGAQPGVAEKVVEWIKTNYPGLEVKGFRHGYFSNEEEPAIVADIAAAGADVLLVAMGSPRQDIWINTHRESLGVKVAIGVGGLFDFYSGRIQRAPLWIREIGMEWCYRMMQEPGRMWRRYVIGNNIFLYHVLKERFSASPKRESVPEPHAEFLK